MVFQIYNRTVTICVNMRRVTCIFIVLTFFNFNSASEYFDLPCTGDGDCNQVTGATCDIQKGTCLCPGYSVIDSFMTTCLPVLPGAGSECIEDGQCSASMLVGGACINGKCACIEGMHYHGGYCWPTKVLGEVCARTEECLSLLAPNSLLCEGGVCTCAIGFQQREYSDCRPIVTEIGGSCGIDTDCVINGSYCDNMQCKCLSGPSEPGTTECKPLTKDEREQFLANRSIIKPTFVEELPVVVPKEFGKECSVATDCAMTNTQCTPSGYCACQRGFFVSTDDPTSCIPEIGSLCSSNDDCKMGNSTCTNDMCTCLVGFGAASTRKQCLLQSQDIRRDCSEASQCMLFGGRTICKPQGTANVCDCDPSAREITFDHICWIIKGPGQDCADPRDCYITDKAQPVSCNDAGKCECLEGYHPSTDGMNCHLNAPELGNKCTEDPDCDVENAMCSSSKCACKSGYVEIEGECFTGVGGTCTDVECADIENSECKSGKCACAAGFISNEDITSCLPVRGGMGEQCTEVQQCTEALGDFAACTDEVCMCAKKHHIADGKCIPSKGLEQSCERKSDCHLDDTNEGVVCRNYVCSCDFGYVPNESDSKCISSGHVPQVSAMLMLLLIVSALKNIF